MQIKHTEVDDLLMRHNVIQLALRASVCVAQERRNLLQPFGLFVASARATQIMKAATQKVQVGCRTT